MSSTKLNIFVTGANGVLGRNVSKQLRSRGHNVVGMIRNKDKGGVLESFGVKTVLVPDVFNSAAIAEASKGTQVFINTISPLPLDAFKDMSPQDKQLAKRLRTEGVKSLCSACNEVGAKVFLHQSLYWSVIPEGGGKFDEDSKSIDPKFEDFLEGERILLDTAKKEKFTACILRFGLLYGPESSITQKIATRLMRSKIPIVGQGDNLISFLHTDDAASAFVKAAEELYKDTPPSSRGGIYHLADERPSSMAQLLQLLAKGVGASEPSYVPKWLASMAVSSDAIDFLTSSAITSNSKFKTAFNWNPTFKSFDEGVIQVTEQWKNDGTLSKINKGNR